jgi:hypothetical protein
LLEIEPVPDPADWSLRFAMGVTCEKLAAILASRLSVIVHGAVPEQSPLHPVNIRANEFVAKSVTTVPGWNAASQPDEDWVEQRMPPGLLNMELAELSPITVAERATGAISGAKFAVTIVSADSETVQAPVPEHPPPLQPVNIEPAAGDAVNVTLDAAA